MDAQRKHPHVAQPPPAGNSSLPPAKPCRMHYRRNLPHIQSFEGRVYVTFCTRNRWVLPESVRDLVIKHCLHEHGRKYTLHAIVVMPDHVHMILKLHRDNSGRIYGLSEIMSGIKGASSHSINSALSRKGKVWQDESFDHVLRSSESTSAKIDYISNNPVRKGLVAAGEQWRWYWREGMELPQAPQ